jgi:hypothetical protein
MTRLQIAQHYRAEMAFASAAVGAAWLGCLFFMLDLVSR